MHRSASYEKLLSAKFRKKFSFKKSELREFLAGLEGAPLEHNTSDTDQTRAEDSFPDPTADYRPTTMPDIETLAAKIISSNVETSVQKNHKKHEKSQQVKQRQSFKSKDRICNPKMHTLIDGPKMQTLMAAGDADMVLSTRKTRKVTPKVRAKATKNTNKYGDGQNPQIHPYQKYTYKFWENYSRVEEAVDALNQYWPTTSKSGSKTSFGVTIDDIKKWISTQKTLLKAIDPEIENGAEIVGLQSKFYECKKCHHMNKNPKPIVGQKDASTDMPKNDVFDPAAETRGRLISNLIKKINQYMQSCCELHRKEEKRIIADLNYLDKTLKGCDVIKKKFEN